MVPFYHAQVVVVVSEVEQSFTFRKSIAVHAVERKEAEMSARCVNGVCPKFS